jgi:hypothetical protein
MQAHLPLLTAQGQQYPMQMLQSQLSPQYNQDYPQFFSSCFITKTNTIDAIEAYTATGIATLKYTAPLATVYEV